MIGLICRLNMPRWRDWAPLAWKLFLHIFNFHPFRSFIYLYAVSYMSTVFEFQHHYEALTRSCWFHEAARQRYESAGNA